MATTKKFHIEDLDGLEYGESDHELLEDEVVCDTRHGKIYELTFKEFGTGDVYSCSRYEVRDVPRWPDADEDDMVECTLMKPVEVTVTKYVVAE